MIPRIDCFNRLIQYKDTEFVKVITGVRRSGKSFMLKMFGEFLLTNNISEEQILSINFESFQFSDILTAKKLYTFIQERVKKNQKMYFLFDEIQEVEEWQKVVNSLRVDYDADIYITGSNANLLSGELATYLSGRYVEISIFPLSFSEFLDFHQKVHDENLSNHWKMYTQYGGFPSVVLVENEQIKKDVLSGILDSILLKDVSQRGKIREIDTLGKVANFLFDSIGQTISVNRITNTLNAENQKRGSKKISNITIEKMLQLLVDSFIFYKVERFDIRGKERLKGLGKYYAVDLGLRNRAIQRSDSNRGSQLENVVYLELVRRGYDVFVGKYHTKEIDFVAKQLNETMYVQVALELPKTSKRETENLLYLPDNYQKIVITESIPDSEEIDGIKIQSIIDFLRK